MNKNLNSDIIVHDTIDADQIEDGDQIIIDGEPIEGVTVHDDPSDPDAVIVKGFSWETGDAVEHTLPYDYSVDVWSV